MRVTSMKAETHKSEQKDNFKEPINDKKPNNGSKSSKIQLNDSRNDYENKQCTTSKRTGGNTIAWNNQIFHELNLQLFRTY